MTKIFITERLSIGDLTSCRSPSSPSGTAIVHACKEPCHRRAIGYTAKSLSKEHPAYLAHATADQLYLNLIDPPVPLFQLPSFQIFLEFVDQLAPSQQIHIHCNQGQSRAPSLALLLMAKRWGLLPKESFAAARAAFPIPYAPSQGIARFLQDNWSLIV